MMTKVTIPDPEIIEKLPSTHRLIFELLSEIEEEKLKNEMSKADI